MTIEIIQVDIITDIDGLLSRAVIIHIANVGVTWQLNVGGLPELGDLQVILDARFDELWIAANDLQVSPDIYSVVPKRALKAFALVILDEINILRAQHGLALRTASQIDNAIKVKLMG